jgi:Protein of unknown function (DUF3305)
LNSTALLSIPVGVVVERLKAASAWVDFVWRPASVLEGVPTAPAWTPLGPVGDSTPYYAGTATIELHRTETANYMNNLGSDAPLLWVVLRPSGGDPPYDVLTVTADPAEGEAFTEAGNDIVETVPMPAGIAGAVEAFIAEHHVERPFFKRQREDAGDHRRRGKTIGRPGRERS